MIKKFFILIFLIFSCCLFSQERIKDVGGWLSLATNYKFNQKQSISIMGRIRQYENFTQTNSWYVDIGYSFKFANTLKVSVHYAINPSLTSQNYFRNIHQYYLRIDYKKFINKYFTFYNRIISQHSTHLFLTDFNDNGYKPYYRTDLRERTGFSYNLNSSSEIYLHNEWMFTISQNPVELRRNRLYCGYEKKVNDKISYKTYFVLQSSFHKRKSADRDYFIFGLDINFNLN
jgi:hypothetical protein